jgi:hypothetical protein
MLAAGFLATFHFHGISESRYRYQGVRQLGTLSRLLPGMEQGKKG